MIEGFESLECAVSDHEVGLVAVGQQPAAVEFCTGKMGGRNRPFCTFRGLSLIALLIWGLNSVAP